MKDASAIDINAIADADDTELGWYIDTLSDEKRRCDELLKVAFSESTKRRLDKLPELHRSVDERVRDGKPVTYYEVNSMDYEPTWCITKDSEIEHEDSPDADECDFECHANLKDGIYEVECTGWNVTDRIFGIRICNGRFVPTETMKTIQNLMRIIDDRHHHFIEAITWSNDKKCFVLSMGS